MEYNEFRNILHRYLNGTASAVELLFIEKWYSNIDVTRGKNEAGDFEQLKTQLWSRIIDGIHPKANKLHP
ncbi:MAG: hypothetical protein ABI663_10690 [Chryseolinea sp.]